MLEPGTIMLKWIGILLLAGLVLRLLLLILLAIEAHRDSVLNEIAAHEKRKD